MADEAAIRFHSTDGSDTLECQRCHKKEHVDLVWYCVNHGVFCWNCALILLSRLKAKTTGDQGTSDENDTGI